MRRLGFATGKKVRMESSSLDRLLLAVSSSIDKLHHLLLTFALSISLLPYPNGTGARLILAFDVYLARF